MSLPSTFSCQKTFRIQVNPGFADCIPWFTGATLTDAYELITYSEQIIYVSSTTASITYTVLVGPLPDGLTLSSGGLLSGEPTTPGTYQFTIRATDGLCVQCDKEFTLTVVPLDDDCWVEDSDTPGDSISKSACLASSGYFKLILATQVTASGCPESDITEGLAGYHKEIPPSTAERRITLNVGGQLAVNDLILCGNPFLGTGLVQINQTNIDGLSANLILLSLGYPLVDIGVNGSLTEYTGIIPPNVTCRLDVGGSISLSGQSPETPIAAATVIYHLEDTIPP